MNVMIQRQRDREIRIERHSGREIATERQGAERYGDRKTERQSYKVVERLRD